MPAGGAAIAIDRIGAMAEIESLRSEWEALAAATPEATAFQSYVWCRAFLTVAAERAPGTVVPRILTVREHGRLVMLWPLQQFRFAGLRLIGFIGEPMTQYGDVLAEPGPGRVRWQAAALAELRRWRVDLLLLRNQRADGVLAGCGGDPVGWSARRGERAPYLALRDGAPDGIIAAQERSMRRRVRRLGRRGEVGFVLPEDADGRAALARDALRLKRDWLRSRRLFSRGLSHPLTAPFLEELARDGILDVAALTVGGVAAAVELGLSDAGGYRSLVAAYDLRFAEGAPGHALTARLVEAARGRNLPRFDFLAPADAAKGRWASAEVPLRSSALPLTWRGHVGLQAYRLRPLAKRGLTAALRGAGRLRGPGPVPAKPGSRLEAQAARAVQAAQGL